MPNMTPHQHFQALTDKLAKSSAIASATAKVQQLIKLLQSKINIIIHLPESTATPQVEERVREDEQRMIDKTPILTILRFTDTPPHNASMESNCKTSPEKDTAASSEID
jgi:hypothetical protein